MLRLFALLLCAWSIWAAPQFGVPPPGLPQGFGQSSVIGVLSQAGFPQARPFDGRFPRPPFPRPGQSTNNAAPDSAPVPPQDDEEEQQQDEQREVVNARARKPFTLASITVAPVPSAGFEGPSPPKFGSGEFNQTVPGKGAPPPKASATTAKPATTGKPKGKRAEDEVEVRAGVQDFMNPSAYIPPIAGSAFSLFSGGAGGFNPLSGFASGGLPGLPFNPMQGLPTGQIGGQLPAVFPTGQVPAVFPAGQVPAVFPAGQVPAVFPAGQVPAVFPAGQVPAVFPTGQAPSVPSAAQFPSFPAAPFPQVPQVQGFPAFPSVPTSQQLPPQVPSQLPPLPAVPSASAPAPSAAA